MSFERNGILRRSLQIECRGRAWIWRRWGWNCGSTCLSRRANRDGWEALWSLRQIERTSLGMERRSSNEEPARAAATCAVAIRRRD